MKFAARCAPACGGGRIFVGVSPVAILEIDEASGALVSHFEHQTDVGDAVGLLVEPLPSVTGSEDT